MKIVRKEIGAPEIQLLIWQGARVVKFQGFASKIKEHKQIFRTKVVWRGTIYVCYHHRPFPFMITRNGKIFNDLAATKFQNKPSNC